MTTRPPHAPEFRSASETQLRVGRFTISYLRDGEVHADPVAIFPGTTLGQWRAHPGLLDEHGRLTFSVGGFLVRSPASTTLIDLGLGSTRFETPAGASYEGGALIDNLECAGAYPDDVNHVVFTHLHRDHVGWVTRPSGAQRVLTFPRARHVVHQAEWSHWCAENSPVGPDEATVLAPLAGTIQLCDDLDVICPGVRVLATPGHTAGHISLLIGDGSVGQVVIAGDVLHSPAQLQHPDWCFGSDAMPDQAAASRARLLDRHDDIVACGHFTAPRLIMPRDRPMRADHGDLSGTEPSVVLVSDGLH